MVETVHVVIGKYLAGKVSYGQSATGFAVKQTFTREQIVPIASFAFDYTVFSSVSNGFSG